MSDMTPAEGVALAEKHGLNLNGYVTHRNNDPDAPRFDAEQFEAAAQFLAGATRTKTARRWSSYKLKHVAERWSGRTGGTPYISNGMLIMAALELGFEVVPYGCGLNAYVGVGARWVRSWRR